MAWTYSRMCYWCGGRFETVASRAKFCCQNCSSSYKYWAKKNRTNPCWHAEHEIEAKEYNEEQREAETTFVDIPRKRTRFDKTAEMCREQGISYAEWQKQDTLRKLKEWEQARKEKKNG